MRPSIVSGIVTGNAQVRYWPISGSSIPCNSPRSLYESEQGPVFFSNCSCSESYVINWLIGKNTVLDIWTFPWNVNLIVYTVDHWNLEDRPNLKVYWNDTMRTLAWSKSVKWNNIYMSSISILLANISISVLKRQRCCIVFSESFQHRKECKS